MDSDNESYTYDSDGADGAFEPIVGETSILDVSASEDRFVTTTFEAISREKNLVVGSLSETLGLSTDASEVLLRFHRWSREKAMEVFLNDSARALKECGVLFPPTVIVAKNDENASSTTKRKRSFCAISYEEYATRDTFCMHCDEHHRFSNEAWTDYIADAINVSKQNALGLTCPGGECDCVIPRSVIARFLSSSPAIRNKYDRFVDESFVELNRKMTWCPSIMCGDVGVVIVSCVPSLTEYVCPHCNKAWCFSCSKSSHRPMNCELLSKWEDKCSNESETANWLLAHTKPCPSKSCGVRIEKNQGCNHMTCRTCGHHFCWVCLQEWGRHGNDTGGYYNCNRFKSADGAEDSDTAKAANELKRYLHYYSRFQNHAISAKLVDAKIQSAEAKMDEMVASAESSHTLSECTFLRDAATTVAEARRVLQYTYPFAYYLENGPFKELFEDAQSVLEAKVEELTALVEAPLEKLDGTTTANKSRITRAALASLLEAVEGREAGIGAYADIGSH